MLRRKLLAAAGVIFACNMLPAAISTASADSILIRSDEWYPMNGDPSAAKPGFMIEIARNIFTPKGIEVDYKVTPWERSIAEVRSGKADCVIGAFKGDAPDLLFPQENWGVAGTYFYVKKGDTWTFNGMDSLKSRKIGIIGGYDYDEGFTKFTEANPGSVAVVKANNALEQNIKKLLAGRIDLTLESKLVMDSKLKEMGHTGDITMAGQLGETQNLYIACTPNSARTAAFIKDVDEGTQALRASGQLQKIMESYGLKDWK